MRTRHSAPPESQCALNASPRHARYARRMIRFALALLIAAPAFAEEAAHTGVAGSRSMPELSDLALAALAAGGIWLVRRGMRARFRRAPKD